MASAVDIANLALAHLGDDATVATFDPPDGSPQAEHCARFYPIARDTMLEMMAWSFATVTSALGDPLVYTVDGWAYVYALPSGCIAPLLLYPSGSRRDINNPTDFDVETTPDGQTIILTDLAPINVPTLRYTIRITDTLRFTPLFVDALSWLLASMIAGPVLKGEAGATAASNCYKVFLNRYSQASTADANKGNIRLDHMPQWMGARASGLTPRRC